MEIVERLETKKVRLYSLKENFDTATPTGKLMLTMIAAINEFERLNILERQREGIAIAKREKRYKGRNPKELEGFAEVYAAWKNKEITAVKAGELLGINRGTFYNRVKQMEKEEALGWGQWQEKPVKNTGGSAVNAIGNGMYQLRAGQSLKQAARSAAIIFLMAGYMSGQYERRFMSGRRTFIDGSKPAES